jgi:hypothetical protein
MVAWVAMINSAAEARSQEAKVIGCRPDSAHTYPSHAEPSLVWASRAQPRIPKMSDFRQLIKWVIGHFPGS